MEKDLLDDAGCLDGQVDTAHGIDGADRLDAGRPVRRLHHDGRHGRGRRLHGGEKLLDRLFAKKVETDDSPARHNKQQQNSGDDKEALHGQSLEPATGKTSVSGHISTMGPDFKLRALYCTVWTVLSIPHKLM